jgi:tetratricopeptide (TPR) repeat protein
LLAKEPGSVMRMQQVLKAAKALDLSEVVKWICDLMLEAQRQARKASKPILLLLTQCYSDLEEYVPAIQACEMARELTPNDDRLAEALQELSAKYTIKKGKYDEDEGDFTRSVKDMEGQQKMMQKEARVKKREFLLEQIAEAGKEYEESSTVAGKINAFVDALTELEEEDFENQAIDVLGKAYKDTGAYQFKMRLGDIRIRQMHRARRAALGKGDRPAAIERAKEQLKFELQEFAERVTNYPTDLALKYELGRRQLHAGQYDEAIASLQQAQRDPRRRIAAMNCLGQAFAKKAWYREAAETYDKVLQTEMPEDRAKEIRYNLGDVLAKMEQLERAQDEFSRVAQIDFNYKDVRQRLEAIRQKLSGRSAGPGAAQ